MHISDVAELCYCLENFSFKPYFIYKNFAFYDEKIFETLLKLGFDINKLEFGGGGLFYYACKTDDLDKVNLLIENGLDLEDYGGVGLNYACEFSSYDVFERLIQAGIKPYYKALENLINGQNFELLDRAIKLLIHKLVVEED